MFILSQPYFERIYVIYTILIQIFKKENFMLLEILNKEQPRINKHKNFNTK